MSGVGEGRRRGGGRYYGNLGLCECLLYSRYHDTVTCRALWWRTDLKVLSVHSRPERKKFKRSLMPSAAARRSCNIVLWVDTLLRPKEGNSSCRYHQNTALGVLSNPAYYSSSTLHVTLQQRSAIRRGGGIHMLGRNISIGPKGLCEKGRAIHFPSTNRDNSVPTGRITLQQSAGVLGIHMLGGNISIGTKGVCRGRLRKATDELSAAFH